MTRRFALVTVLLTATAAFLVGLIVAGSLTPTPVVSGTPDDAPPRRVARSVAATASLVNFADVAERINPAVVNIDATSRAAGRSGGRRGTSGEFFEPAPDPDSKRGDSETPRRGAGSGFIIDPDGHILTNNHVVERADRIVVKLSDGRNLRAKVVGSDPDTDIALIKVESPQPFPTAPLGDSDTLRVGEWVCAIGNPLAYEHTVTVGVVSYIGRKLFDSSLDNYIQTDAAINFGNSGGPLINARGEVIGINAAISSRASSIGFAIPVNQATSILEQLKTRGRVARGFIGVALKDVDADLQRSLNLGLARGALVQDVTAGSPGDRAGLKTYDLITSVDRQSIATHDELIRRVSATAPGSVVHLDVIRDGRALSIAVKLAERQGRGATESAREGAPPHQPEPSSDVAPTLGLTVRDLDRGDMARLDLPEGLRGVIVARVEAMSPAFDADIERGQVILEVNRKPVTSMAEFRRVVRAAGPGEVLTFYIYTPSVEQRFLRTIRVDGQ
jgi:serine protease Do